MRNLLSNPRYMIRWCVCADELDVSHFGGRVRKSEVPKRRKLSLQMHYVKVHSFLDTDRIDMHSLLLDWFLFGYLVEVAGANSTFIRCTSGNGWIPLANPKVTLTLMDTIG